MWKSSLPGTEGVVEVAVTGVTTAFAAAVSGGTETAERIWVAGLAGDGTGL